MWGNQRLTQITMEQTLHHTYRRVHSEVRRYPMDGRWNCCTGMRCGSWSKGVIGHQ